MNARFSFVAQNDPRLTYTGDWIVNDAENPYVADPVYGGEDRIETDNYVVPHFPDGIRQAINAKGASFTLETSADSVMVMGLTSKLALKASVTVDGSDEVIGTCGPTTETTCMNQISDWVELPGDGKTHTVKFTIPDSTEDGGAGLFRFGYIIERYDGE